MIGKKKTQQSKYKIVYFFFGVGAQNNSPLRIIENNSCNRELNSLSMLPAILLRITVLFRFMFLFYIKQKCTVSPEPWIIPDKCTFFTQHSHIEYIERKSIYRSVWKSPMIRNMSAQNRLLHLGKYHTKIVFNECAIVRCAYSNNFVVVVERILYTVVHRHMENNFHFLYSECLSPR